METQAVMAVITAAITMIIGIFTVTSVITSVPALPTFTAYNESINFATNMTNYTPSNYPLMSISSLKNSTHSIPAARFGLSAAGTGVWLMTNGSYDPGAYLLTYTYQNLASNTTWTNSQTVTWNSIQLLAIALVVIAAGLILSYFGFGIGKSE